MNNETRKRINEQGEIVDNPIFFIFNKKIHFRDRNGQIWSEECIKGMIETIILQSKIMKRIAYYNSERTDGKDYYREE